VLLAHVILPPPTYFLPCTVRSDCGPNAYTTDAPAPVVEREPSAAEDEIRWVLEEVRRYLFPDIKVRRGDVLSAWSGSESRG
jgi:hypothetical protein